MKRKSTRTQGIKRKIAILLSIAMLFTLAFTGTALAKEVNAYESVNYAELEELLENGSPGDFEPNWAHTPPLSHLQLVINAMVARPNLVSASAWQLLQAGMVMPDGITRSGQRITCQSVRGQVCRNAQGADNLKGLRAPEFRGFHGYQASRQNGNFAESNYVAAFSLITQIANRNGETGGTNWSLTNPGLTPGIGGEFYNIRSRFRRGGNTTPAEGMRLTCSAGHSTYRTWQQIMDLHGMTGYRNQNATGQAYFRRFFIWGIALHALADVFEHSAMAIRSPPSLPWGIISGGAASDSPFVVARFGAAQDAVNLAVTVAARPATHHHRHGCCCKFLAASSRFNGGFRLANLTRYVYRNRRAVNNQGLSAAQLAQLRPGDIWFQTNQNRTNDLATAVPLRCSRHSTVNCNAC